jgi:hypothetical protein
MSLTNYKHKRLQVYASDGGDVTISGDLYIGAHRLTTSEFRKLLQPRHSRHPKDA